MSPNDSLYGTNKLKLLGAKSWQYGECCSCSQHISSFLNCLMGQLHGGALSF